MLEIDNLQYEYARKVEKDAGKIKRVFHEKDIILKNHEHDIQQMVYKLLHHLREIKYLKQCLERLEDKKTHQVQKELGIISIYKKRLKQIEMIHQLSKINLIGRYCNDFEMIELDVSLSDDEIRIDGINLIQQLKI
jgi:hypothetical protein